MVDDACGSADAVDRLRTLLAGGSVTVEIRPVADGDRGLASAYLWVDTGSQRVLVNDWLIRQGLATVGEIPTNSPYLARFWSAQADAQLHERGVWATC
jgi:endonuclease YncB( thermonuclease family)